MENKRVAIYARVSTNKQDLQNQLNPLKEYAKKQDWEIYKIYSDIISGSKDSRPDWDALFIDAHRLEFDIVLFWSLDRLSRSGTLYTLQKLKELENLKIDYVSYTEKYLNSLGEFKDVIISIMSTLGKVERERRSERTKAGLAKAENVGKRGKDKKPRKVRSDRGIKRGGHINSKK